MSDVNSLTNKLIDGLTPSRSPRPYLALAVVGALLFLPLLGWYGLWDPHEVKVADMAREMAHTRSWAVPSRFGDRPPMLLDAIAAGYRVMGNHEIAGRLPVALLAILALLACFYAGSGLLPRRAALLGSIALLTMPVFFLGARQLTSAVAPILGTTLAIGGLARAAWPRRDEVVLPHLMLGLLGLFLGQVATGFALGVAVPLIAVAIGVWVAGTSGADQAMVDAELAPASGIMLPRVAFGVAALGALALVIFGLSRALPGGSHVGYSWIVGGTPHAPNHLTQSTTLLKQVGFGAFPWIALVPLALARLFAPGPGERDDDDDDQQAPIVSAVIGRDGYGRFVLLAWALTAYLATTLYVAAVGEVPFGAYAALALLAGSVLDDAWDDHAPQTVAALLCGLGAVVIAHDFFMAPEGFAGAHLLEALKWPPLASPPFVILAAGLLWGALVSAALVMPREPPSWLPTRHLLLAAALVSSLALTAVTVFWMVPALSQHLSYKGLFVKYKSIVGTGSSEIGKYHVPGQLSDYGKTTDLASLPQMFDFLGRADRVFVITSADDLPAVDQYAKQREKEQPQKPVAYYVIDDSNSKFLMLSNQLGNEKDLNPLRRFVLPVAGGLPHPPEHVMHADFEGKVELLGYDLPNELERGKPFKMTMYYKVNQPVGGAYRIFMHFDGPGTRFNGDHTPLDGKFPTTYWVPGFYIVDEYTITPDRATQPSGNYTIYSGFWLGDQRLKVVSGASDGENRVKVGTVRVK